MLEIKRILCAVDLLKPVQAALSHAVWLAGVFGTAQLDLVNASLASLASQRALSPRIRVEKMMLEHNGREKLDRLLEGVAPDIVARSTSHVLGGKPISAILAYAQVSRADLIVLGVGQTWAFTRLVRIGVAEQVIQGSSCPLLTVRAAAAVPVRIEHILVPVDFSACTEIALEWAAALAERFGARLAFLHVNSKHRFRNFQAGSRPEKANSSDGHPSRPTQLAELAQRARVRGADVGNVLRADGGTSTRILELAESGAYDLIVMGLHPAHRGTRILGGGVGSAVRLRSSIPVLSVRACEWRQALIADDLLHEPNKPNNAPSIQRRELRAMH